MALANQTFDLPWRSNSSLIFCPMCISISETYSPELKFRFQADTKKAWNSYFARSTRWGLRTTRIVETSNESSRRKYYIRYANTHTNTTYPRAFIAAKFLTMLFERCEVSTCQTHSVNKRLIFLHTIGVEVGSKNNKKFWGGRIFFKKTIQYLYLSYNCYIFASNNC